MKRPEYVAAAVTALKIRCRGSIQARMPKIFAPCFHAPDLQRDITKMLWAEICSVSAKRKM